MQQNDTRWVSRQPLIFYPWAPSRALLQTYHRLIVGGFKGHQNLAYRDALEKITFLDSQNLSLQIIKTQVSSSGKCYILEMLNPLKTSIKAINCAEPILDNIICINESTKNFETTSQPLSKYMRDFDNDLFHCKSGEYVSSLFVCDGSRDCQDGLDEVNCTCYHNGQEIIDNWFCSKNCSRQTQCLCPILYTNQRTGCFSHVKSSFSVSNEVENHTFIQCHNRSIFIRSNQ